MTFTLTPPPKKGLTLQATDPEPQIQRERFYNGSSVNAVQDDSVLGPKSNDLPILTHDPRRQQRAKAMMCPYIKHGHTVFQKALKNSQTSPPEDFGQGRCPLIAIVRPREV